MKLRTGLVFGVFALAASPLLFAQPAESQLVLMRTNLGDIEVSLLPGTAPATVANFLSYMNKGAYDNTIFHRSVRGFIIQAGGYKWDGSRATEIPQDPPVRNEFGLSNIRGTIAMAKLGDNPNSATNQWFFNLGDNSANLNNQNGGFTVFGRISSAAGLAIMDKIAAVPVPSGVLASPFDQIPLQDYTGGDVKEANLIIVRSIRAVERPTQPTIQSGGVVTASAFGAQAVAAPGSFIEVYGANLGGDVTRTWATADFTNGRAPTALEGVSVSINGQPCFISYVSPTQVNAQIPVNVPIGEPLPVVVTHRGVSSAATPLPVRSVAGGLLAPASFKVGEKQYVVAIRPSTNAFISNGTITGVAASPAVPGETVVFYGTGFGQIGGSTTSLGGQVAEGTSRILSPVEFKFGSTVATVSYAGLTPGLVGLYQFNVVIPANAGAGDVELTVSQGGAPIAQKLFIPIAAAN